MKKENIYKIAIYVILFFSLIINIKTCSISTNVRILEEQINAIKEVQNEHPSVKEVELLMKIIGYDISYRMLYDNNTIIRTTKRPDDIMKEYTDERQKLQDELLKIRNEKL